MKNASLSLATPQILTFQNSQGRRTQERREDQRRKAQKNLNACLFCL